VILVPQTLPLRIAIESLEILRLLSDPDEWVNRIRYLPSLADFLP
jgi:hypothetical protein